MSDNLIEEKITVNEEEVASDAKRDLKKSILARFSKKNVYALIVVLLMVAIGSYFIFFYNMGISGFWTVKQEDMDVVFNFRDDGTISFIKGSIEVQGQYEVKSDNKVNIDFKLDAEDLLSGDFSYRVKSDLTSRKLELTDASGKVTTYTQCKEPKVKYLKNFVPVDKIIGTWFNAEQNLEHTFLNNGIAKTKVSNITITRLYTVDEDKITFILNTGGNSLRDSSVKFVLEGDKLLLNGSEYVKK